MYFMHLCQRHCKKAAWCAPRRPIYTSSLEGGLLSTDLRVAADLREAFEEPFFQYEVRPPPPHVLAPAWCACHDRR
jgi:hypothetical protein